MVRPRFSPKPRFDLGIYGVTATPGALELLDRVGVDPARLIRRHHHGDWGVIDAHDREMNERSLREGGRLMSAYDVGDSAEQVWIITEGVIAEGGPRHSTTILLPSEY